MAECSSCKTFTDCLYFVSNPSGITTEQKTRYVICRVCLGTLADKMYQFAIRDSCRHCLDVVRTVRSTLEGKAPEGMIHIPITPHSQSCRLKRTVSVSYG